MQNFFLADQQTLDAIERSLSPARFARYVRDCRGDRQLALRLYRWNSEISQSLYWPIQTLEIVCRNGVSRALSDRYGQMWHLDQRFHKELAIGERTILLDAIHSRNALSPPADSIIPDISFGFWSRMLTRRYEVPIGWTSRLSVVFPAGPPGIPLKAVTSRLDEARNLRNRLAHHEPLTGMYLRPKYLGILQLIEWACPVTQRFVEQHCTFADVFEDHPDKSIRLD